MSDCYIGKDGEIRKTWGKKQKGRDEYWDKATPIKVTLGELDKAIQTVQGILDDLMSLVGPSLEREQPNEDISPF